MAKIKEILTFLKAQTSAGIATGIDYGARIFFNKLIGVGYVGSTFLGALIGGIANCCINYRWVFKNGDKSKREVMWRYFVVWAGSIALNTMGTWFFKAIIGLRAYTAMILTSALVAILWNYMMQRSFVFGDKNNKK